MAGASCSACGRRAKMLRELTLRLCRVQASTTATAPRARPTRRTCTTRPAATPPQGATECAKPKVLQPGAALRCKAPMALRWGGRMVHSAARSAAGQLGRRAAVLRQAGCLAVLQSGTGNSHWQNVSGVGQNKESGRNRACWFQTNHLCLAARRMCRVVVRCGLHCLTGLSLSFCDHNPVFWTTSSFGKKHGTVTTLM